MKEKTKSYKVCSEKEKAQNNIPFFAVLEFNIIMLNLTLEVVVSLD